MTIGTDMPHTINVEASNVLGDLAARIKVEHAPTEFGEVSVSAESDLASGIVTAVADLPARRNPARVLLRLRLPEGFRINTARAGGHAVRLTDRETVDLSGMSGRVRVEATVAR